MGEHNFTKAHEEYAYSKVIKELTGLYRHLQADTLVSVLEHGIFADPKI